MPDVPSALPKAEAARLRGEGFDLHDQPDAELDEDQVQLDEDLSALAAEVRKHAPVLGTRGGLEERLWAALDRAVGLLEARLDARRSAVAEASTMRQVAETMDRLGHCSSRRPRPSSSTSG